MTSKTWMAVRVATLALGTIVFLLVQQPEPMGRERQASMFTIGVITPLTGGEANYGRSTQRGVDLAIEEINARLKPKGVAFEARYQDDQMNPTQGTNAAIKLITADRVPVIIGPFGSSVVLAVAPTANRNKTVIISASATADAIADAGDYVFRIVPPNQRQARDIAGFVANKLKAKNAFVLYLNNHYGVSLRDAFVPGFEKLGGKVVGVEGFESGATDFRTQLTRINQLAPAVVFFPDHYKETALILRQARELGLHTVFIGADAACTNDMLKLAGPAAEGTYYANMAMDFASKAPAAQTFVSAFRDKYHEAPDVYSAYAYDAMQIAASAVLNAGYSGDAIRRYLYTMPPYKGLTGETKFDSRGEVNKPFAIQVVKEGRFQPVP